jgi:hypothetical protein
MTSSRMPFMWLFIFLFSCALVSTSCDNRCANSGCKNGAECYKGECLCAIGYEGVLCETAWAEKFLGNFTTVNAANCAQVFSSDITQTDRLKLKIRNLGGFIGVNGCMDYSVSAKLTSSTSFSVDETFCNNFRLTARGDFNETTKKLSVQYNCIRDSVSYTCTAVYQY